MKEEKMYTLSVCINFDVQAELVPAPCTRSLYQSGRSRLDWLTNRA